MLVVLLGALFVLGGLIFMVAQPIWRGRLIENLARAAQWCETETNIFGNTA
jgi:hypothetical protein